MCVWMLYQQIETDCSNGGVVGLRLSLYLLCLEGVRQNVFTKMEPGKYILSFFFLKKNVLLVSFKIFKNCRKKVVVSIISMKKKKDVYQDLIVLSLILFLRFNNFHFFSLVFNKLLMQHQQLSRLLGCVKQMGRLQCGCN